MDRNLNEIHLYPMKKNWQYANQILGVWSWLNTTAQIVTARVVSLIIPWDFLRGFLWDLTWERRASLALRKVMTGESRSYLQISENGLVYRNWPFFEMRCNWEDVKCIKNSRWSGDILYVQRAEGVGFPEFSINLSPPQIHLSSLVGWHDGGLKDDLQQHAPQLFRKS